MQISDKTDQYLHKKLPIDADEKILGVYRHHWFAYASNWIVGAIVVVVVMALAVALTAIGGSDSTLADHRVAIIAGAAGFSTLVLLGTFIPVYLRSQEELVLTQEALLQALQPSLFASKIDQLNLHRIDDISVRQDFLGTVLGYGHLTIETPGEQDNYEFFMLPDPHGAAREITQARENYEAAMQSGRMHTTLGEPQAPAIDPRQYEQFLEFQQMMATQQAQAQAQPATNLPPAQQPPAGEAPAEQAPQEGEQNPPAQPQQ